MQGGSYVQLKSVKSMLFTVTDTSTDEDLESSIVGADMALAGKLFQRRGLQMEKRIPIGVDGIILYQESLLMASSWYTSGCQVLVCWDFSEVIDNPVHHCDFVLFSPWLRVLPTKFLSYWSDTAGSAAVTVASCGRTMTCSIWPWHPLDSSKDFYGGML